MTKAKISEYDASAGNNTDVNNVNIAEGCAPSGINNAIREVMAALKRFETGADGDSVTVGGNLVVSGSATLATTAISSADINAGTIDGTTIGGSSAAVGTFTTANATTVDTTNIEVTNIKAKDGTAAATIADSTGKITVAVDASISGLTVGKGGGADTGTTVIGSGALQANTTGLNQVAVGYQALYNNTSANANQAFGYKALWTNTTGVNNFAGGHSALYSNTTGGANVSIGREALYSNTTASNNTAVGYQAGYNTTGGQNTFIGGDSGYYVTTGTKNTILGFYNGNQGGLDIRTSSNYVVLSDGDGNWGARWFTGISWYQQSNNSNWATTSDQRIKENIVNLEDGLSVVCQLRPVEFDYILSGKHDIGFIAQEYEQVLPDQITHDSDGDETIKALTNGEPVKGIQQNLVPYLVKAIQELNAKIEAQAAEIAALKGQ